MLRLMGLPDTKAEARINRSGLMLYLAAYDDAKEAIKQTKTMGHLNLGKSMTGKGRTDLIKSILGLIATENVDGENPTQN